MIYSATLLSTWTTFCFYCHHHHHNMIFVNYIIFIQMKLCNHFVNLVQALQVFPHSQQLDIEKSSRSKIWKPWKESSVQVGRELKAKMGKKLKGFGCLANAPMLMTPPISSAFIGLNLSCNRPFHHHHDLQHHHDGFDQHHHDHHQHDHHHLQAYLEGE